MAEHMTVCGGHLTAGETASQIFSHAKVGIFIIQIFSHAKVDIS